MKYYVESICGGSNAAGGGCGAPRGVMDVTKEEFDRIPGQIYPTFLEHTNEEVSSLGHDLSLPYRVKIKLTPCVHCRITT